MVRSECHLEHFFHGVLIFVEQAPAASLGWTPSEIGERMDLDRAHISKKLCVFSELKKSTLDQAGRGRSVSEIAESESLFDNLVEVLRLEGKDDAERLDYLKCSPKPFDVWQFSGCDERFGSQYPGRIPGQLILLARSSLTALRSVVSPWSMAVRCFLGSAS